MTDLKEDAVEKLYDLLEDIGQNPGKKVDEVVERRFNEALNELRRRVDKYWKELREEKAHVTEVMEWALNDMITIDDLTLLANSTKTLNEKRKEEFLKVMTELKKLFDYAFEVLMQNISKRS